MSKLKETVRDGDGTSESSTTSEFVDTVSHAVSAPVLPAGSSSIADMEMDFDDTARIAIANKSSTASVADQLQGSHISTPFQLTGPPATKKRKEREEKAMNEGEYFVFSTKTLYAFIINFLFIYVISLVHLIARSPLTCRKCIYWHFPLFPFYRA
jgi:hypothetical protein